MSLISEMARGLFRKAVTSSLVNAAADRGKKVIKREAETAKLFARYSFLRTRRKRLFARIGRCTYPFTSQNEDIPISHSLQRMIMAADALLHEMEIVRNEINRRKAAKHAGANGVDPANSTR